MTSDRMTLSRRSMLRLTAGRLLALGLWPGALRAQPTPSDNFHFVVLNDIHYMNDRCTAFLERVRTSIRQGPPAELCLIAGDLSDHGTAVELMAVKKFYQSLEMPTFVVPGNHDYRTQTDRKDYDRLFPGSLNYYFEHKGWRFVALDSTDGLKASQTRVQPPTMLWLDQNVSRFNSDQPMVLFTHFPLGDKVTNRPTNADDVLDRFLKHNLRGVFGGHFHSLTERTRGETSVVTNRCCSISRPNHDKSKEKGYFLGSTRNGQVTHQFVEVSTEGLG